MSSDKHLYFSGLKIRRDNKALKMVAVMANVKVKHDIIESRDRVQNRRNQLLSNPFVLFYLVDHDGNPQVG